MANKILHLLFLLLSMTACIEETNLDTPDKEKGAIVIQGKLSIAEKGYAEAYISRTFAFSGATTGPIDVLKASVSISDDEGNSIQLEGGLLDGYYRASFDLGTTPLKTAPGTKYRIQIKTIDNKSYQSSFEEMPELPVPDSLRVEKENKEIIKPSGLPYSIDVLKVFINTPLRAGGKKRRIVWTIGSTFKLTDTPSLCNWYPNETPAPKTCYVDAYVFTYKNLFFDGSAVSIDELKDYPLFERSPSIQFAEGLYFNVIQQSLNKDAFEYLKNSQELLERTGSMFDQLPGLLHSNMVNIDDEKEAVYGFFYPTMEDTIRVYVSPELAGNPDAICPQSYSDKRCCDCLTAPNSSTRKPPFWEF